MNDFDNIKLTRDNWQWLEKDGFNMLTESFIEYLLNSLQDFDQDPNDVIKQFRVTAKLLGLPSTETFEKEVIQFIKAGQKINAIKKWRELTGVGLKESKDAIEAIIEREYKKN